MMMTRRRRRPDQRRRRPSWLLRLLLILLAAAITLLVLLNNPRAHSDPGGVIPAPGLCEYPGVGSSGQIMNAYYYWCDFPTEINGSHHHCVLGGFVIDGSVGVSILMFNAGVSGHIGGITGSCSWRCPDNSLAAQPNPPGGWKDPIKPIVCKSIGPNPDVEVPAPVDDPISPPTPIPSPMLPSVTDPACPNPDATVNSACGG
jgi:hypothetical protein